MLTPATKSGRFISILSDGLFHESVNPNTEGAILREYELKDGTKGSKHELLYKDIEGEVVNVQFRDGDYGEQVQITVRDNDEDITISQGVGTNFGEDLLKKLPNIQFEKRAKFAPYAFTDDSEKERRGVTIYQDGEKVSSHFWDGEKNVNGYPTPEGDTSTYKSDDWKLFYLQARKFLVNFNKETVVPKFDGYAPSIKSSEAIEYPENDLKPEDIGF